MDKHIKLKEVFRVFLKLGFIGFGGPAVHIAMMEEEVVRKRKWISAEHFLDLVGATNLIPGPNSTEMTMHLGNERAGKWGLIVAGCCFILPAVFITGIFAWAYKEYGQLPEVAPFISGIKPAIISVVLVTMINLARKALKNTLMVFIGILAAIAAVAGINEIAVLFGCGLIGITIHTSKTKQLNGLAPFLIISSWKVFFTFLKIGSILYGSGYVLFAFLDAELVSKGLLSKKELIDAIAVGQFTPGPVFSSATFIGYQLGGIKGAIAATIGIFLPSFLFVALLNPWIPKLRRSGTMSAFLDAVNVASIAIILSVLIEMGREAILDWRSITIAITSLLVTALFKQINSAFIVIGGAILGYLLSLIQTS